MRVVILLGSVAWLAGGQTILEDFRCRTAVAATNANPVVLTCNEEHGWDTRPAQGRLAFTATAVQNGDTVTVDGVKYTFVTALNNENPGEILIDGNRVTTARRFVAAVNDSGEEKGTGYSSATVAHPAVAALKPQFSEVSAALDLTEDTVFWRSHGMQTGDAFTMTSSNSSAMTPPFAYFTTYYAIRVDDNRFRVATSAENAAGGVYLDLTTSPGGNFLQPVALNCGSCFPSQAGGTALIYVYIHAREPGLAGAGKTLASSAPSRAAWAASTMQIQFFVRITGAAGSWAGLGSDAAPKAYTATVVDAARFSVPWNSSSAGSFSGQDIRIRTANGDGGKKVYPGGEQGGLKDVLTANRALALQVPSCEPSMSEQECSKGYWSADNQKAYGVYGYISSFVVSGGTITITLTAPWADMATYETLAEGQLIHVRGLSDHIAQHPLAALMSKGSNRGFRVQTLNANRTVLTINNPGLADGTYSTSCSTTTKCVKVSPQGQVVITWRASPYMLLSNRFGGYLWPSGYDWWNSKNPLSFHPLSNRFRYWVRFGKNFPRPPAGGYNVHWGNYMQTTSQDNTGSGSHFYHYLSIGTYRDQWQLFEFNCAPSHQVGAGGGVPWPDEPLRGHAYYPVWRGGPRSCMEGQTVYYQDFVTGAGDWSGQTLYYSGFAYDYAANEPEEYVRSRSGVWSPERYISGALTASPGYDIMWEDPPIRPLSYEIRYSTAGSLKANGWSSGTDGGTVQPTNTIVATSRGTVWQSPEMAQADHLWVGIRPVAPVAGTTSGGSPIWVLTFFDLGLTAGDTVTVQGVGGNTAANQTDATILEVRPRRYYRRYSVMRELGAALPGELAGITASGGTCTANFTVPHGLAAGWVIEVVGSANAALGPLPSATPKRYVVSGVTATTAAFSCPGVSDGVYSDPQSAGVTYAIIALPGVAIAGSSNGDYTSGGTIVSTGNTAGFAEVHLPAYVAYGAAPSAPGNLTATGGNRQVILNWADLSTDEAEFVLERRTNGGEFGIAAVLGENTTSYTDTGLQMGVAYSYRIRARNAAGDSIYSNEALAVTDAAPAPPAAPGNLQVAEVFSDRIHLRWSDLSSAETSFEIQISVSGGSYALLAELEPNTTEFMAAELTPLTPYRFRVRAVNELGASAWVESIQVTTLPGLAWRMGGLSSTAASVLYRAPSAAPCTLNLEGAAGGVAETSSGGGVRARYGLLKGLTPGAEYRANLVCAGASASIRFTTPAEAPAAISLAVSISPPAGLRADNLVVEAGSAAAELGLIGSLACAGGRCEGTLPVAPGSVRWVRYRWCRNRAVDPSCANPANEVSRSGVQALVL